MKVDSLYLLKSEFRFTCKYEFCGTVGYKLLTQNWGLEKGLRKDIFLCLQCSHTAACGFYFQVSYSKLGSVSGYLTIIPRARMGSESIAHEAEG